MAVPLSSVPDLKRRCSAHKEWLPATDEYFYRTNRKMADGTQLLDHVCKRCRIEGRSSADRAERESETAKMLRKAKLRARQRAWVATAHDHPETFEMHYKAQLAIEGWDGDEDLRNGSNKRKGKGIWSTVKCRREKSCGWIGRRKAKNNPTTRPCPWCDGRVFKI